MESKYYTPTIEEFHVGFEFEAKFGIELSGNRAVYVPGKDMPFDKLTAELSDFKEIENLLNSDCVRVKYLDKEDIESLGFKESNEDGEFDVYYGNGYILSFIDGIINVRPELITMTNPESFWFRGTIKNKSELKRILKQIEYENRK